MRSRATALKRGQRAPDRFSDQKRVGGSWTTLTNVVGNTQKTSYYALSPPVTTDGMRLVITQADNSPGDGYARIGEVMLFGVIPPSGTAVLLR